MGQNLQRLGAAIEHYINHELKSSQLGVARRSGGLISQGLISLICKGQRDPAELSLRNLQGLLLGLGMTRDEFIARFGHEIPPVDLEDAVEVSATRKQAGAALERHIREMLLGDRPGKYKDIRGWADKAGVSRAWLYGVFSGRFDPTELESARFARFLHALKLSPEEFARLTGLTVPALGKGSSLIRFPVYPARAAGSQSRSRALGGPGVAFPADELENPEAIRVFRLESDFYVSEAALAHPKSVYRNDYIFVHRERAGELEASWWPQGRALLILTGEDHPPLKLIGPSGALTLTSRTDVVRLGSVVARLGTTGV